MRYLIAFLKKDLKSHLILLSGPRQCGKTTLAKSLLKESDQGVYLNWDQPKDRKKILKQEWSDSVELLVLDEVHKKKDWKTFLKGIFDTKPEHLHMLVTGSARLEYFQKSGDSMFGRYRDWRLHPFCLQEDPLKLPPAERLERLLERGGFPYPYLAGSPEDAMKWRNQRWNLLLKEDVRDLESIRDFNALELLAELIKPCAGNQISYSNIAEDAEIAPKTAKLWIHILEKLYLIFLVKPYSGSLKRTLSKTPKLFFLDTGDLSEQSRGCRIENLVANQLLKRIHFLEDAFGDKLDLHYVRDKEEREVDFLITRSRKPIALIEVKASFQEPAPSLKYFKERLRVPFAIQLHAETGKKPHLKEGIKNISITDFFSSPIETRKFWE